MSAPIVETTAGKLRGAATHGVLSFKGISYAHAARFHPPAPPPPWPGIRDALALGPPCPQINDDLGPWRDPTPPSEDCLVLNLWTPSFAGRKPVMVWIHGGFFESGSGGLALYDGATLAREGDVVVVTLNHRLNVFGYLHLGGTASLGQLDLVAALDWVRDNIAGFGGDPGNVTLFGESGGGAKISVLLAMKEARGRFHKAIIQSGSMLRARTPDQGRAATALLLAQLGAPLDADLPAERLLAAYRAVQQGSTTVQLDQVWFGPVLGDDLPPVDLPLLVGTTRHETVYLLGDADPADDADLARHLAVYGADDRAIALYRQEMQGASRRELLIALTSDAWMTRQALRQAERATAPVFVYDFAWRTPCFGGSWALHGGEIPFVFGTLDYCRAWDAQDTPAARASADPAGARFALRDATIAAWSRFARTGAPGEGWPAYTPTDRAIMTLDATPHLVKDPRPRIRAFLTRPSEAAS